MGTSGEFQVLLCAEAEGYVRSLTPFDIPDVGSVRWCQQHEYLEKLNMQAVISASKEEDEFVKEFFITFEKVPTLIHDLIATEIWKKKIFPEIVLGDHEQDIIFPLYAVLYHEAIVVNLLETLLFHQEACMLAQDMIVDLIDYCYYKLIYLSNFQQNDNIQMEMGATKGICLKSTLKELEMQDQKLSFDIAMKAVSILSYVISHLSVLPLACTERILNIHDIPLLLVQLLEAAPWKTEKSGEIFKYEDSAWRKIELAESPLLVKHEGQVWIAVLQLLVSTEYKMKYELISYKKGILLRLRPYLTEILIDQIPALIELQYYLDQLAVLDTPAIKKELIMEQVPDTRERIIKTYEGHWTNIAQNQSQSFFSASSSHYKSWACRLAETYCSDAFENLIAGPPKCAFCGHLATKRCSRCTSEWYCSRKCQVSHWSKHKQPCGLLNVAVTRMNSGKSDS